MIDGKLEKDKKKHHAMVENNSDNTANYWN